MNQSNHTFQDDLSQVSLQALEKARSWQDRFRLLTAWGKLIQEKPSIMHADNAVKGCETAAWLSYSNTDEGKFEWLFYSESVLINGLAALLLKQIQAQPEEVILELDIEQLLLRAGLGNRLTPSRSNGFRAIYRRVLDLMATAKG